MDSMNDNTRTGHVAPLIRGASVIGAALLLGACATGPGPSSPAPGAGPGAPAAPGAAAERPPRGPLTWRCGAMEMSARYDNATGRVTLAMPGKPPMTWAQLPAASGIRYGADGGNEFWSKGREATLTLAGEKYAPCVTVGR